MAKERPYRNIKVVYENAPFLKNIEFHSFSGDRMDFLKNVIAPKLAAYGYSWGRRINLNPQASKMPAPLPLANRGRIVRLSKKLRGWNRNRSPHDPMSMAGLVANKRMALNEMAQLFVTYDYDNGGRPPLSNIIVVRLINLHHKRKPKKVYNTAISNVPGQGTS